MLTDDEIWETRHNMKKHSIIKECQECKRLRESLVDNCQYSEHIGGDTMCGYYESDGNDYCRCDLGICPLLTAGKGK